MKFIKYSWILAFVPFVTFAQGTITGTGGQNATNIVTTIKNLLDSIVPVLIVLALLYFIYGVAKYIMSSGEEEAQKEARGVMIYGIIALFVIVSVWGIVGLLQTTFGVGGGQLQNLPEVPN